MLKTLHCGLLKFLELDMPFFHYFDLFDKSSGSISRIDDGDEDEDFGTNNNN